MAHDTREEVTRMAEKQVVTVTPNQLAAEIFGETHATRQGKRIRAWLRSNGYRTPTEKGQAWSLSPDTADAVRARFTPEVK